MFLLYINTTKKYAAMRRTNMGRFYEGRRLAWETLKVQSADTSGLNKNYQSFARFSGASHILLPGLTPKASWNSEI